MKENEFEIREKISGQALVEKNKKIKKETLRLKKLFKGLKDNKKKIAEKLIENAAFMAATLEDLQRAICPPRRRPKSD